MYINEVENSVMESVDRKPIRGAIKRHAPRASAIHPKMNLEIDLGLDSLARAECIAGIEQTLGIEFNSEEVSRAQTVGELVKLANSITGDQELPTKEGASEKREFAWHDALNSASSDSVETESLRKRKPVITLFAYLILRLIYIAARLLFGMEVKGIEVLEQLEPPYLICPNHQSYLDPFLVCATYPRRVLGNVFHVGAAMYFTKGVPAQIARLVNVIPIDP